MTTSTSAEWHTRRALRNLAPRATPDWGRHLGRSVGVYFVCHELLGSKFALQTDARHPRVTLLASFSHKTVDYRVVSSDWLCLKASLVNLWGTRDYTYKERSESTLWSIKSCRRKVEFRGSILEGPPVSWSSHMIVFLVSPCFILLIWTVCLRNDSGSSFSHEICDLLTEVPPFQSNFGDFLLKR